MPSRRWLVVASLLAACGGREAGFSPRPTSFPLPPGVYEVRVALEFDAAGPGWTLPLPEATAGFLVITPAERQVQRLTFFDVGGWQGELASPVSGQEINFYEDPALGDRWPDELRLEVRPFDGRCAPFLDLVATDFTFLAWDDDGDRVHDRIDGTLAGTAIEHGWGWDEPRPSRSFRGRLQAVPDRTPPAIRPVPEAVSPWGLFQVRFTEPVFFEATDFALLRDGGATPLVPRYSPLPTDSSAARPSRWDRPLLALPLAQDPSEPALPPGAAVRLARLRVRDLAGNVFDDLEVDAGLRVAGPEVRPTPSFEDGALAGWETAGGVRAVRGTAERPAPDGDWFVAAPLKERFSLMTTIDVPDTTAPTLELSVNVEPASSPYREGRIGITAGAGDLRVEWYGHVGPASPRLDLSPLRGRRASVVIEAPDGDCRQDAGHDVVLDSFRVLP